MIVTEKNEYDIHAEEEKAREKEREREEEGRTEYHYADIMQKLSSTKT